VEVVWIFRADESFTGVIEAKIGDESSFEYLHYMNMFWVLYCALCLWMNCTMILLCICKWFTKGIMLIGNAASKPTKSATVAAATITIKYTVHKPPSICLHLPSTLQASKITLTFANVVHSIMSLIFIEKKACFPRWKKRKWCHLSFMLDCEWYVCMYCRPNCVLKWSNYSVNLNKCVSLTSMFFSLW